MNKIEVPYKLYIFKTTAIYTQKTDEVETTQ